MESPAALINKIISISLLDPRIEAVILTGSRGRERHIDHYSDTDIELIGLGVTDLFHDQRWINQFGHPLVALHLINGGIGEPESPTCLVIYEQGRKVDFTFAEPCRLQKMQQYGLDDTYARGYTILLDKTGITEKLPNGFILPSLKQLSEQQFTFIAKEFWYEAHQVAIALLRNEMWSAWSRDADMKKALLTMTECLVSTKQGKQQDVWYNGKNYQTWMPETITQSMETLFDYRNAQTAATALHSLMTCFDKVTSELARQLNYPIDPLMNIRMQELVIGLLQDRELLPEGI
ncbi:aminoglycoside 6-adenylyltransferase [Providencia manganoxydans]|uniref:aminoglycoside 6-adenylyltransferase n=1 Tax=Providencia manganoxydans TaxID=2923283 RepID=UPI0032DB65E4